MDRLMRRCDLCTWGDVPLASPMYREKCFTPKGHCCRGRAFLCNKFEESDKVIEERFANKSW